MMMTSEKNMYVRNLIFFFLLGDENDAFFLITL